MKLYTTIKELKEYHACYNKNEWLIFSTEMKLSSETQKFSIADGLSVVGIKDCLWALRTQSYEDYCLFLADIADLVLPYYKKQYPSDEKAQSCISMIRKYKAKLCSKEELLAAAEAAYDVAYSAFENTASASAVAEAAATTIAEAATTDITAYTVAITASIATSEASIYNLWEQIEELFIKHFSN